MTTPRSSEEILFTPRSRRWFLGLGAALGSAFGSLVAACRPGPTDSEAPSLLGDPVTEYGDRSAFETASRVFRRTTTPQESASLTPLHDSVGMITPADLHFERHHAGVPHISPNAHHLLIHGLVDRPLIFTMEELRRLPSVSRIYFLECSGNTSSEWSRPTETGVQGTHGLTSCSEWTGVPLRTLLDACGLRPDASWVIAEGADACKMARSVPLAKALDDALVAYGQNGEALRPEQGYPLRLLLPGWEGNINVKWLRRLEVVDQPYMTRDETSKYTDLLGDGRARLFTLIMDPKSVITRPSPGHQLPGPGVYEISGLAWSGRGAIQRVEVTTDAGATWQDAELQAPVLPRAHTRFRLAWTWNGGECTLQSRCTDDTGLVQPTREALVGVRGLHSNYHNNSIQSWRLAADGTLTNVQA